MAPRFVRIRIFGAGVVASATAQLARTVLGGRLAETFDAWRFREGECDE